MTSPSSDAPDPPAHVPGPNGDSPAGGYYGRGIPYLPIDVSVERLMARRVKLKFYEAGLDLGWSANPLESFRLFQGKVLDEYDQLVKEFGMEVVDARGSITDQQRLVRNVISQHLHLSHLETTDDELV